MTAKQDTGSVDFSLYQITSVWHYMRTNAWLKKGKKWKLVVWGCSVQSSTPCSHFSAGFNTTVLKLACFALYCAQYTVDLVQPLHADKRQNMEFSSHNIRTWKLLKCAIIPTGSLEVEEVWLVLLMGFWMLKVFALDNLLTLSYIGVICHYSDLWPDVK